MKFKIIVAVLAVLAFVFGSEAQSLPKAWKVLTVISAGTVTLDDATTTISKREGGVEEDPLGKPFVKLPTPVFFAVGYAGTAGIDWLGLKMYRSRRFHKIWWMPQTLQVIGNSFGAGYTIKHGVFQ